MTIIKNRRIVRSKLIETETKTDNGVGFSTCDMDLDFKFNNLMMEEVLIFE